MRYIKHPHLRAASTTRRRNCEAHRIKNIHKGKWSGRIRTGTIDESTFRSQCRKFVTNSTTGLECQSRFIYRMQYALHRIWNRIGDRAVDGTGGWFVLFSPRVGYDSSSWNRTILQSPDKIVKPPLANRRRFDFCQRFCNPRIGIFNSLVDDFPGTSFQTIFSIPGVK